jgi:hypothetical protein
MIRRLVLGIASASIALSYGASIALATGQPGVECGDPGLELRPPGFDSWGFTNAEDRYAGSANTGSLNGNTLIAVSQYDVACLHFTSSH